MMLVMCIVMWLDPRSSPSEPLHQLQEHDVDVNQIATFSKISNSSISPQHLVGLFITLSSMQFSALD